MNSKIAHILSRTEHPSETVCFPKGTNTINTLIKEKNGTAEGGLITALFMLTGNPSLAKHRLGVSPINIHLRDRVRRNPYKFVCLFLNNAPGMILTSSGLIALFQIHRNISIAYESPSIFLEEFQLNNNCEVLHNRKLNNNKQVASRRGKSTFS